MALLPIDAAEIERMGPTMWEPLRDRHIFLTGCTGFVGQWMIDAVLHADRFAALGLRLTVLTRDAKRLAERRPDLVRDTRISVAQGDVRTLEMASGSWDYVIHGAADAAGFRDHNAARDAIDTMVNGTQRVLALAEGSAARAVLLLSSGAVYGVQPPELPAIPEGYAGAPDPLLPGAAYGISRRAAECLGALHAARTGQRVSVARCFAFSGPGLPLDGQFAIGNFVADALAGRPISVKSGGQAVRTYLYGQDMAIWLWTLLLRGGTAAYNVGGTEETTIASLAETVARLAPCTVPITVSGDTTCDKVSRYVPDVSLADSEFGLRPRIGLAEGIQRMFLWHGRAR